MTVATKGSRRAHGFRPQSRLLPEILKSRGALAPAFAILSLTFILLAALVLDGGRALAARGRAVGYAQEAARAGAAAIDPYQQEPVILPNEAAQIVADFCARVKAQDSGVQDCEVRPSGDPREITVRVGVKENTSLMGLIGVRSFNQAGTGTARVDQGIMRPDEEVPPPTFIEPPAYTATIRPIPSIPTRVNPCNPPVTVTWPNTNPPPGMPSGCKPAVTITPCPTYTVTLPNTTPPPGVPTTCAPSATVTPTAPAPTEPDPTVIVPTATVAPTGVPSVPTASGAAP